MRLCRVFRLIERIYIYIIWKDIYITWTVYTIYWVIALSANSLLRECGNRYATVNFIFLTLKLMPISLILAVIVNIWIVLFPINILFLFLSNCPLIYSEFLIVSERYHYQNCLCDGSHQLDASWYRLTLYCS